MPLTKNHFYLKLNNTYDLFQSFQDMNNLLQEKRKLIAEMANSDLENLDTVFEISQNDLDVDNKTILLDMILNGMFL